jgi:repressor LexA
LTERQKGILDYIVAFTERSGYAPSLREIGERFRIRSTNGVRHHLGVLSDKGYIERDAGRFRGIKVSSAENLGRLVRVPLLGRVAAGELTLAVEEREETIGLDPDLFPSSGADDLFALQVTGDSMIGAGIADGDLAVVSRNSDYWNGDIVVAIVDDEATLKRFHRMGGKIELIPANENYKTITVNGEDEGLTFRILGKVIGIIRTPL